MNLPLTPTRLTTPVARPFTASCRTARRERDFGIGYGSSSGYAATRRYATPAPARYFRFA